MRKKPFISLFFFFFTFLVLQVGAGGICLYEISSADTRLASAGWSARASDPSTLFTNPAGMTRLCEKQIELGAQAIYAHVNFNPDQKTSIEGKKGKADIWLPSGSFFYIHPCTERLTLGLGNVGYFGADLVYNHDWVGRYYVQKALLEGISLVPAAAYKINNHWSIGAGANVMYGFLKQRAAVRNVLDRGTRDGYFNLHDYQFGIGGVFGLLFEPTSKTRFGIQYLSPVKLDFRARPKFHDIGPILKETLKFLRVTGSRINLHISVPQSVMISAYHQVNEEWSILANIGWQQWSRFQRLSVELISLKNKILTSKTKYQDTWHAAIGLEWDYCPHLTFSSGVAYDSSAVSHKERPLNFPVGQQWRFGSGARWTFSDHIVFDFSAELQWSGNLKAKVMKPIAGHVEGIFKNTYALFINTNLTYVF